MTELQIQPDLAHARAAIVAEPTPTQAKLPVFGTYFSAAINVTSLVPGHGPATGLRAIRVWVPGLSSRQLPAVYKSSANFYFRPSSRPEQVLHMIPPDDNLTVQPDATSSSVAQKRRKLDEGPNGSSSIWAAQPVAAEITACPPHGLPDTNSVTLQRRLKRASNAALNSRSGHADEDVISDPGRMSPHPVDILYEYLLHNDIKLAFSDAPNQVQQKSSHRWSRWEQDALFAYVLEEKPSTQDDWASIGLRLGRSGQACKAQFSQCHAKVEERILNHFTNSPIGRRR